MITFLISLSININTPKMAKFNIINPRIIAMGYRIMVKANGKMGTTAVGIGIAGAAISRLK